MPAGLIRKLHILSDGTLAGLGRLTRDDLPRAGLSPAAMEILAGLKGWRDNQLPPVLGLSLWYLATAQRPDGSFIRASDSAAPNVGVAVRFLQLNAALDRPCDCDGRVARTADWLISRQTSDGGIRMTDGGSPEVGTTARALAALFAVRHHDRAAQERMAAFLRRATVAGGWPTYVDGEPTVGSTSLAIHALATSDGATIAERHIEWLLAARHASGGWGEVPGAPPRADNTFWAIRALAACNAPKVETKQWEGHRRRSHQAGIYDELFVFRLRLLHGERPDTRSVEDTVSLSLGPASDQYAEVALGALALAEEWGRLDKNERLARRLPRSSPPFLRREPAIYDAAASVARGPRRLRIVDWLARNRVFESVAGWVAGALLSLGLFSSEFVVVATRVDTIGSYVALVAGTTLAAGWIAVRRAARVALGEQVVHALVSLGIAGLVLRVFESTASTRPAVSMRVALVVVLAVVVDVTAAIADRSAVLDQLGRVDRTSGLRPF